MLVLCGFVCFFYMMRVDLHHMFDVLECTSSGVRCIRSLYICLVGLI